MKRIGVFICHCGINIKGTIDVEKLTEELAEYPGVAYIENYIFMCSEPGQKLIRDTIVEHKLDGVVVAACSPTLHETTFQDALDEMNINRHQLEIANIREQCSWVHDDIEEATRKANLIIKTAVEKLKLNESLIPISAPLTKRVLIIGGGIAGIQAALDIADGGYEVILVEKEPSIGGHMIQLSETFPTLDCSQCIMTPKMVAVNKHKNIKLFANSEVESIEGFVGNFKVNIKRKPQYVDPDKCTICDDCTPVCPVVVPSEYDEGMSWRKAIYIPFPQSIPATFTIDTENCLGFNPIACTKCSDACEPDAIDYDKKPEYFEEEIGAVIVATGFDLYPVENMAEYGYGKYPDVLDGLQFERILSATGPTGGEMHRPSDGKVPKEIVFIQCSGSRDPERHLPYCSRICCMYTIKHAKLYKHKVHDGQPYIFYIDIRSGGKRYEEFVQQAVSEDGIVYFRGKVARIYKEADKMIVHGIDTLTSKKIEIKADMVVLAMGIKPNNSAEKVISNLKLNTDENGFLIEAHPKLRPVESLQSGFYLAGTAQGPKDIPDTVSQASAAAAKVLALLSNDEISHSPIVAIVNEELCSGCGICVSTCPYGARELDEIKKIATVNDVLCEGCGACISVCPSSAAQQKNLTDEQILNMVKIYSYL